MTGFDAGGESWHLCWPGECDKKNAVDFRNRPPAARQWLDFLIWRAGASRRLRDTLEVRERPFGQPLSNDAMLQRLADLLSTGRLNACRIPKPSRTFEKIGSLPPAFPLSGRSEGSQRESKPEDQPTFAPNVDAATIAALKREAAQSGVPFCEECMRQRAAAGQ